jgi:hypothetical protein
MNGPGFSLADSVLDFFMLQWTSHHRTAILDEIEADC